MRQGINSLPDYRAVERSNYGNVGLSNGQNNPAQMSISGGYIGLIPELGRLLTPHANCTDFSALTIELVGEIVLEALAANIG